MSRASNSPTRAKSQMLSDRFRRVHTNLRISVTDRCNIRCFYCMPNEAVPFRPRREILTFEEITRFARIMADLGINKLRITGGEPLTRAKLPHLIEMLRGVDRINDIAMTTNGLLLKDFALPLRRAGLDRLNISLDSLSPETFKRIARRDGLEDVLAGITAARRAGFTRIRLNTVAIRNVNEDDIIPLAAFAQDNELELRFIEFMPLDAEQNWQNDLVISGREIRERLVRHFGDLVPAARPDLSQPAVDFEFSSGGGTVGFIDPVTHPFCDSCNRLRITAEGKVRNCLFSTEEWDARSMLRGSASDEQIMQLVMDCVEAKKRGHGIDSPDFIRPEKAMYQIGG